MESFSNLVWCGVSLQNYFFYYFRTPLILEIWTKDKNVKDQLFGIAQVNLSSILDPDLKVIETNLLILYILSVKNLSVKNNRH